MDNIKSRILVVTVTLKKYSFYSLHYKDVFVYIEDQILGPSHTLIYGCMNLITYAVISFVTRTHFFNG